MPKRGINSRVDLASLLRGRKAGKRANVNRKFIKWHKARWDFYLRRWHSGPDTYKHWWDSFLPMSGQFIFCSRILIIRMKRMKFTCQAGGKPGQVTALCAAAACEMRWRDSRVWWPKWAFWWSTTECSQSYPSICVENTRRWWRGSTEEASQHIQNKFNLLFKRLHQLSTSSPPQTNKLGLQVPMLE